MLMGEDCKLQGSVNYGFPTQCTLLYQAKGAFHTQIQCGGHEAVGSHLKILSSLPKRSKFGDTWTYNSITGRGASVITLPFKSKTFSLYKFSFMFIFGTTYLISFTSAYGNFSVSSTTYSCSSNGNLNCLGQAHVYNGTGNNGIKDGRLSLMSETLSVATDGSGLAYYNQPIRFKDPSTNRSASFNTSFSIDIVIDTTTAGDGMAFVISADNQTVGSQDRNLGIFNSNGVTSFKSIVVEFDGYYNAESPEFDINDNHVSFDFSVITTNATANASNVGMVLLSNKTLYAWVEYISETQKLEARVSYTNYRPVNPLLEYTVDIYDKVEEYMWIGFSAGTSGWVSNYYIADWTFESYGIPPTSSLSSAPSTKAGTSRGLIVGISVGVPALLLASIFILLFVWRRSRDRHGYRHCPLGWAEYTKEDTMAQFEGIQAESFSYRQLSLATNGFNDESKLGQGGFGSVHRGVLPSSAIPVAVKKINSDSSQGEKEFMAEVSIISRLRHRNLIRLLGWCKDVGRKKLLLVYELMPNKSLDKWLFAQPEDGSTQLSWEQRFNIVTGTAAALDYLHQGWTQQVIHRDIKSSNIMLDENWNAKLGDFGLARLVDHERTGATTIVAGTYGYIAPEVGATCKFSDKTDVFAFGIVVLEVACGRKALSASVPPDEMVLVDWVWRKLNEGDLLSTVDNRLRDYDLHWMELVLTVGLLCAHRNPLARPSMRQVVQVLAGDTPVPSIQGSIRDLQFSSISQGHSTNGLDSRGNAGSISGSTSRSSFNLSAATGASTVKSSSISLNSISSVPEEISSGDRHW